jgi:hypothetical protein
MSRHGADIATVYLADEEPEYCTHCGHPCFAEGTCALEDGATERSEIIRSADALLFGAPVYCWQPNALTCALFDKFRVPRGTWIDGSTPGIPAMGIAVAGGSGTGVFPALQSMYAWMCAWRFTPLSPVPVTRYNIDSVIDDARRLADELLRPRKAAFSERWDHMLLYDRLPYMRFGRIDEFEWLSARMVDYLEERRSADAERHEAAELLDAAGGAAEKGEEERRAECVMLAFGLLYPLCL